MKLIETSIVFILVILALPILAVADGPAPDGFDKYFSNISEKLLMSDEQVKETRPIFLSYYNETASTFQKYGFNPEKGEKPGIFKLEDMKKDIEKNEKQTDNKLSTILSKKQMEELNHIRDEEAKQLMQELKEHEK